MIYFVYEEKKEKKEVKMEKKKKRRQNLEFYRVLQDWLYGYGCLH